MKVLIVEQNEMKSYTIPSSGILYVAREKIISRSIANITIFFSGGQNIKLSYDLETAEQVYQDIQRQLDGAV